ncbi:tyrosine-type recombinase/integrase [Streptomyces sp. NPDC021212]|uniref:tyrosine-type recombinase/integrase n=1 Tax=Streptomyces sp. NPDC021212 TaxID=3365118 RepID=UPI0037B7BCCD
MTHPGLVRNSSDRAIKQLGLPAYTPHDLRHKWATVTLTNGVSIHEVSRWLGHRSIKVTVDRYGHLTSDGRERCRQVVESTFGGYLPPERDAGPVTGFPAPAEPGADLVPAWPGSTGSTHHPNRP